MGFLSSIGDAVGGAWDGIKDAGSKLFKMGNAFSGSSLGGLMGDGISSAAQIAAMKYGYDKSLEGIREQNTSAAQIARDANIMSQANAREQMAFQRRNSSDAHQREVIDLRRAGLNPILSGTGGMGATSPQGASGNVTTAPVRSEGDAITSAMSVLNAVTSMMKTNAEREYLQTVQTAKTQADTDKVRSETMPVEENLRALKARISNTYMETIRIGEDADLKRQAEKLTIANRINTEAHTRLINMNLKQATAELQRMLQDAEIYEGEAGYWIRLIEKLAPAAGKLPSPVRVIKKGR